MYDKLPGLIFAFFQDNLDLGSLRNLIAHWVSNKNQKSRTEPHSNDAIDFSN